MSCISLLQTLIPPLFSLCLFLPNLFPASFPPGPADDEGKPGGYRRELCCSRSADEEALQINGGRVWAGPGEC